MFSLRIPHFSFTSAEVQKRGTIFLRRKGVLQQQQHCELLPSCLLCDCEAFFVFSILFPRLTLSCRESAAVEWVAAGSYSWLLKVSLVKAQKWMFYFSRYTYTFILLITHFCICSLLWRLRSAMGDELVGTSIGLLQTTTIYMHYM
jgi:hypothetical protein